MPDSPLMGPSKGWVVVWEREVHARVLGQSTWETIGQRGFDDPQVFSSYLLTERRRLIIERLNAFLA